ncbi:MAG: TOBE domain-containing protein, partial [Chloroflexota bacterium]|nr:TOBE domain-containing protein [Chloroflexota bacterium]
VRLGTIMAEVVVDVGGQEVVAAITRRSAESLGLKAGDQVTALIKATAVLIAK